METLEKEKKRLKKRDDSLSFLTSFVEIYIREALDFVEREKLVPLDYFDEQIRTIVAEKTGMKKEEVLYLHHAFHWEFFNLEKRVFNYINSSKIEGKPHVSLSEQFDQTKTDSFINYFLEKYVFKNKDKESYLIARYETLKRRLSA